MNKIISVLFALVFFCNRVSVVFCEDEIVKASWVLNDVYLDGKVTNGFEWSECTAYSFILKSEGVMDTKNLELRIKNDEDYLFGLLRIDCRLLKYDIEDQAFLYYLWDSSDGGVTIQGSDAIWIRQVGGSKDKCNFSNGEWSNDQEFNGTADVIGFGSYKYPYYWFEFRKELNSQDGVDWVFSPGKLVGLNYSYPQFDDKLVIGYLDNSEGKILETTFSMKLMNNPSDRLTVGGGLTEETPVNNINYFLLLVTILLAVGHIVNFYTLLNQHHSYNLHIMYIFNYFKQLLYKIKLGEDNQKSIRVFSNMILMSLQSKYDRFVTWVMFILSKITKANFKEFFENFDEELMPSLLLGLIVICMVLALVFIITDSRILDEIFYPYLLAIILNQ